MPYQFDPELHQENLINIVNKLATHIELEPKHLQRALHKFNKAPGKLYTKNDLVKGIRWLIKQDLVNHIQSDRLAEIQELIKMKPTRTRSGVAVVTVLTKPFPCPGKCIFCPNDVRMPKSYLRDEPGAQRAERNHFDPYLQVYNRLQALKNIGHPTSKVELIILGGTWSYYPEAYQIWFVKRCFEALNQFNVSSLPQIELKMSGGERLTANIFKDADHRYDRNKPDGTRKTYNELISEIRATEGDLYQKAQPGSGPTDTATWEELWTQHKINETAKSRCVGLVIETRPDDIDIAEVQRIRKLGCTKVQLGVQTLHDDVNDMNKRGHHAVHVAKAFKLLRSAGFKVHAHLMPNLYGATPKTDLKDYLDMFNTDSYKPDELKIYPTSVIKDTELYDLWKTGKYQPYDHHTLVNLLAEMTVQTPQYCRLTRVIRDIPSTDIEAGNMKTNLREVVKEKLIKEGKSSKDIRWREIRGRRVEIGELRLDEYKYRTEKTTECFLSYVTVDDNSIAGFLRLSLPDEKNNPVFVELNQCAIIREVHVYGQMVNVGGRRDGRTQHLGLGTRLIEAGIKICREEGFSKLAVISGIGTREYYKSKGFVLNDLYQVAQL